MYAKRMGFGTRKDDVRRSHGVIVMRSGFVVRGLQKNHNNGNTKKKRPHDVTRTGCQAALRILLTQPSNTWKCKEFSTIHNHDLASSSEVQFLRSYRVVSDGLLAQVRSMNSVGIKTANIMSHVALQSGGYERMPCQLRDVYNRVAGAKREEKIETDSEGALGFLDYGNSRVDYVAFGDVLGFDTTYMTNEYNKPLTVLIGAIMEHMHDVTHRLCAWHLNTNASKKVKDPIFLKMFKDLMYNYYEEEDFEARWLDVVETQQLTDNEWCQTTFDTRKQWARNLFKGFIRCGNENHTTLRIDQLKFLKKFLEKNYCLREFVTTIDMTISKLGHNEAANDFKSEMHSTSPT
ncbi:protein FAR1-RELATED SEQUENCE 5-like [Cannabis sativa]|uniref:protein FAR1-RELATED SEQUENCE 5-like n=1 Tax=Cannabis sativa TaxID=3483 RepID=UPI0029CA1AF7|nr:protein FAR1-RELATED SEQUENCE 5-like [Cannabis sativa]